MNTTLERTQAKNNFNHAALVSAAQHRPSGFHASDLGAGCIGFPSNPTKPNQTVRGRNREVSRRRKIIAKFDELLSQGLTGSQAAARLRVSFTSIWRWKNVGLVPLTDRCGRKSEFSRFRISAELISSAQRFRAGGLSVVSAWQAVAKLPACPPDLSAWLLSRKSFPPSFYKACEIFKREAVVLSGDGFETVVLGKRL
jgi:hypothetical protein